VQFLIGVSLGVIFGLVSARAQPADNALRVYAVHVLQSPTSNTGLYGVYLGKGLIITAAHVVSSNEPGVRIAGLNLPATIVKAGTFEQVDLTLLAVDEEKLPISLRLRRMPLCQNSPRVGEPVIVAIPEGTARSRIMSPMLLPAHLRFKYPTVISDVAATGNSGSGVFEADRKCLLGIMSRKITNGQKDIAKYFVTASIIKGFIPVENRF